MLAVLAKLACSYMLCLIRLGSFIKHNEKQAIRLARDSDRECPPTTTLRVFVKLTEGTNLGLEGH